MAAWTLTGPEPQQAPAWTLTGPDDENETVRPKTLAITPPKYLGEGGRALTRGEVADFYNRPAKQEKPASVWDAFAKANADPLGALGESAETIATAAGMEPAWAARLGRDVRDLPISMGPLGAEFAPGAPRTAAPIRTQAEMPRASVRAEAELKSTGGARMGQAKASEETVAVDELRGSLDKLKADLDASDLVIDPDLHKTAARVMSRLEQVGKAKSPDAMSALTGTKPTPPAPLTLKELHLLRQKVQTVIENGVRPDGKINQEGLIGIKMKSAVDDMITKHPEGALFNQGKSEYARAEKSAVLTEALNNAKASAQWHNGNQAGAIRNAIRPLLRNKKYKNYWTNDERKALGKLQRWSPLEGAGGFAAGGPMGFTLGRVVEGMLGIPLMSGYAVSAPARMVSNSRRLKQAEGVGELIRAGGPVEQDRISRLSNLLSPKVFEHISQNRRGEELVRRWVASPSAQTARVLATYISQELKMPEMARRIFAEIQGTEQTQADEQ